MFAVDVLDFQIDLNILPFGFGKCFGYFTHIMGIVTLYASIVLFTHPLFQHFQIVKCFHEGQYTLPGPPRNIRVTPMNAHSALASWDPPNKNPEYVELYRILWRKEGAR